MKSTPPSRNIDSPRDGHRLGIITWRGFLLAKDRLAPWRSAGRIPAKILFSFGLSFSAITGPFPAAAAVVDAPETNASKVRSVLVLKPLHGSVADSPSFPTRIHAGTRQWSAEAGQWRVRLGWSLSGADLDADGFSDVVVGAPRVAGPGLLEPDAGSVVVFAGSASGLGTDTAWGTRGAYSRGQFGRAIAVARNLDGNRTPSLIIGAPFRRTQFANEGAAYLFQAESVTSLRLVEVELRGKSMGGLFASAVASAGDLNGDGFGDVAVGAFRATYQLHQEGGVFIYPGSRDGLVADDPRWLWVGKQKQAHCGWTVIPAGDVNRDGFDDLLVGMPGYDTDQKDAGRACLILGSAAGPQLQPGWIADGAEAHGEFGSALAVGDADGDGLSDALIGAPGVDENPDLIGRVFVYRGTTNGFMDKPNLVLGDGQRGSRFGAALALVRDVNGDRRADLLVGAPRFDAFAMNEGRTSLFLSRLGGFSRETDWTVSGGQTGALCGFCVADAGDANGDGLSDFLVGSPFFPGNDHPEGRVDLFYGATNGYARGDVFPVDGTNSLLQALPDTDFEANATSASPPALVPPPPPSFPIALALLSLVLAGALAWLWFHRQHRLHAERRRIARDLHDEVGSHLTRLAHLNPLSSSGGPEGPPPASISATAQAVRRALEEAVWTVDPQKDTLEHLVSFLGAEGEKFFVETNMRCRFDLPELLPARPVASELRKHILQCVREAFANALEHAQASEVCLRATWEPPWLTIHIEDNGRGLPPGLPASVGQGRCKAELRKNPSKPLSGHGLPNLRARMESIGGTFQIENRSEGGTRVTFRVKI